MKRKTRNTAILAFICSALYVLVPDDFMTGYLDDILMIFLCLFTVDKYLRIKKQEQDDDCLV